MSRDVKKYPHCHEKRKNIIKKRNDLLQKSGYSKNYTPREGKKRTMHTICHNPRGGKRRKIHRSSSGTRVGPSGKAIRNKLKRAYSKELSSGTTISTCQYEPNKKKRRSASSDSSFRDGSRSNSPMRLIYKNPDFSTSSESVPNVIAPLLTNWSFGSVLSYRKAYSKHSRHNSHNCPEKNIRVVMVTDSDGDRTQIITRKAVLMHVRETEACAECLSKNLQENIQAVSEATLRSLESDFQSSHDINFIRHVSSLKLMRLKKSINCTNLRLMRSYSTRIVEQSVSSFLDVPEQTVSSFLDVPEQTVSSFLDVHEQTVSSFLDAPEQTASFTSDGPSNLAYGDHCSTSGGRFPESPTISKEDTSPEEKCDALKQVIMIGDNSDLKENIETSGGFQTEPPRSIQSSSLFVNVPSFLSSSKGLLLPTVSTPNDIIAKESKRDVIPCTLLVFVCFVITRLLNIM